MTLILSTLPLKTNSGLQTPSITARCRQAAFERIPQRRFVVLVERRLEHLALAGKLFQALQHFVGRRLSHEHEERRKSRA